MLREESCLFLEDEGLILFIPVYIKLAYQSQLYKKMGALPVGLNQPREG